MIIKLINLTKNFLSAFKTFKPGKTSPQISLANEFKFAENHEIADRIFRSAIRTCRSSGLKLPQAIILANEVALSKTGINLINDYQIEVPTNHQNKSNNSNHLVFFEEWKAGILPIPFGAVMGQDLYKAYKLWALINQRHVLPINQVNFHAVTFGVCKKRKIRISFNDNNFSCVLIPNKLCFLNIEKCEIENQLINFKNAYNTWEKSKPPFKNLVNSLLKHE